MPEENREVWGKQIEFILTLIGYAVGLGNVWRFPYLCFQNGGGAFLIPYAICLVVIGIPMFALECAFGQYGGKGPLTIWSINPLFKGLGISTIAIAAVVFTYYNVIIAQALRYLIASFTSTLPWLDCNNCDCLLYSVNASDVLVKNNMATNNSLNLNCTGLMEPVRSPSEIYYHDTILADSGTIQNIGEIRWELMVCNLGAFILIFLVLVKGISSLGKVVYFTATFPYILLTIFLVRTAMLEGAIDGVKYYLEPQWDRLADGQVWSAAATQIFFSLSACLGGLIAMSSYNRFDNNIIRDAFTIPIINCLTSFYAGFVVFCTLGNMAHEKGVAIPDVTKGGSGLVFVVYPEAIGTMPLSTLWSILFFFMLCILGFSTQFSNGETLMTSLIDEFPNHLNTQRAKVLMRLCVCLTAFVIGIPMTTQGGTHLLEVVDSAVNGFPLLFVGLFEYVVVIFIYGYKNFATDIKTMVGFSPPKYFTATWCFVSPFILVVVIVFKSYEPEEFEAAWVEFLYYLIVVAILFWIPFMFLYNGREQIGLAMQPLESWTSRRKLGKDYQASVSVESHDTKGGSHELDEMGGKSRNGGGLDNHGFYPAASDVNTKI